jgi:hypothetical protein
MYPGTLPDASVFTTVTDQEGQQQNTNSDVFMDEITQDMRILFAEAELNTLVSQISCGQVSQRIGLGNFTYCKVIVAWLLQLDARSVIETVSSATNTFNQIEDTTIEPFLMLFASILAAIINIGSQAAIISDIDEQKPQYANFDIAMQSLVFINGVSGSWSQVADVAAGAYQIQDGMY